MAGRQFRSVILVSFIDLKISAQKPTEPKKILEMKYILNTQDINDPKECKTEHFGKPVLRHCVFIKSAKVLETQKTCAKGQDQRCESIKVYGITHIPPANLF